MTTLMPRDGCRYLKPEEVIAKMQAAFAYVETTDEGARERVAAWLGQLAFVTQDGHSAAANQYMAQLERFQDAARFVHFGHNLGSDGVLLSMLMIPHQPLIASALDYEVFELRSEAEARTDSYAAAA